MQYRNLMVLLVVGMMVWTGCSQQSQQPMAEQPQAPAAAAKTNAPVTPPPPAPMPAQAVQQQVAVVSQKVTATAQEAINAAGQLQTVAEKVNYLMAQAQSFYNSENYQQVVSVAQYVLQNLDSNSAGAKDLLAKAQAKLQSSVQGGVQSVTNPLGTMGTQTK